MKKSMFYQGLISAGLAATLSCGAAARTVTVELANLTHGMYFTPRLAVAHGPDVHLFQLGASASTGLRTMAETGSPMVLAGELPESAIFAVDLNGTSPTAPAPIPCWSMPTMLVPKPIPSWYCQ